MRVFGYITKQCNAEGLFELSEVTFQGSPERLREVAAFIVNAAAEMEKDNAKFSHQHMRDEVPEWGSHEPELPDVIVTA